MFKHSIGLMAALAIALSGCASKPTPEQDVEANQRVYLENSEVYSVYSAAIDQHYRIQVRLPGKYQQNLDQHYPVIIKIDGQWDFLLASNAVNCVYFDGQMPEAIVVGIGWEDVAGDIHAIRARDLLPAPVPHLYDNSGQANAFTNALADEIMPKIEARYRTNGQRVLLGGSWGGLYATYALLQRPDAFFGAIAIAGDYSIGRDVLEQLIQNHTNGDDLHKNRLYMGVGHWDPITPGAKAVAQMIQQANLPGLELQFDLQEGFGHSGMNLPGYAAGYQFVFQRPALHLSQTELDALTGKYAMPEDPTQTLELAIDDKQIIATNHHNQTIRLTAESRTQLYHPGIFYNVDVSGDNLTVTTFFGRTQYQKIR